METSELEKIEQEIINIIKKACDQHALNYSFHFIFCLSHFIPIIFFCVRHHWLVGFVPALADCVMEQELNCRDENKNRYYVVHDGALPAHHSESY